MFLLRERLRKSDKQEKIASEIGYSKDEIAKFSEANLGLGCGNPVAMAEIKKGDTVFDLGSGAGFDCFWRPPASARAEKSWGWI